MARVAEIEVLLLDIGGVLVELSGLPQWRAWTGLEDDEGWHRWLHSPAVRAFESGRSSADEFGVQMVDEFDLPVSAEEFVEAFAAWPTGLLEGASDLLRELRDQPFRLACFSNTNELHWPRFIDDFGLRASLDVHFASHELGLLKPDAESFTEVTPPARLLPRPRPVLGRQQAERRRRLEGRTPSRARNWNRRHPQSPLDEGSPTLRNRTNPLRSASLV